MDPENVEEPPPFAGLRPPRAGLQDENLGNGLWASFDGQQIWLMKLRENGWNCIALEPAAMAALEAYIARVRQTAADGT